jgi:hypothetical protein
MGDQALTDFQREVTNVFFALPESGGYLLIVAATDRRWTTTVIRDAPTFCRLVIHGPRGSRRRPRRGLPARLATDDDAARTDARTARTRGAQAACALRPRRGARLRRRLCPPAAIRYARALDLATQIDPGFDEHVLAEMVMTLRRFGASALRRR